MKQRLCDDKSLIVQKTSRSYTVGIIMYLIKDHSTLCCQYSIVLLQQNALLQYFKIYTDDTTRLWLLSSTVDPGLQIVDYYSKTSELQIFVVINQDNLSSWCYMSACRFLFHCDVNMHCKNAANYVCLLQHKHRHHFIQGQLLTCS